MVFSSVVFLFAFLPVTLALYFLAPRKLKNLVLLLVSLFFYFWGEGKLLVIMIASISINYLFGLAVHRIRDKEDLYRKIVLALGITANLALLGYFKYYDFVIETMNATIRTTFAIKSIALPIGISFFTFQGMTYIIDLYRGNAKVQRNPLKIALYIALFPPLIAGPIIRYNDIAEQIDSRQESIEDFSYGIKRFVFGLGKKVLIANNVALISDSIFNASADTHTIATAWVGAICYTLQIYFDFSGYSDMAIGLGRMFGFKFRENFDYPYVSKSIREFWRRWHISLSSFFRDYLYIPLGGSRSGNVYFNLLIVFLATGLWHGAGWTFIIWGLWHGFFIIIENVIRRRKKGKSKESVPQNIWVVITGRIYTLLVVVVGWVLFRSDSIEYAIVYIKNMFGFLSQASAKVSSLYYLNGFFIFVIIVAMLLSIPVYPALKMKLQDVAETKNFGVILYILQGLGIVIILGVSLLFIVNQNYNPFLYFRF
ncbi:MAG: MBOAT family protein [Clostridiales Family XIII bacterium]|jgi:alginate O-acetyltransferase complex protein AlgI|nr:MBOAT family protein [Clostridiales Family XIII bacterium]